ncbi:hypothetical protein BDU57DRAFT_461208 [Ampelomyces quisqualis]|uniref:tyrosinase n=1 Tax=Ampelomyces quisqualis TaxID=50730 RepID=A0A6A5Q6R0_AMPQU|nr:hypothetical protein BDU57DRAFT_461208 [Ampelomyces quisqualis]
MRNLWTLGSVIYAIVATIVTCTPVEHYDTLKSRQSSEGVVAGIAWRDENGNVPVRREVRDLKENYPDQWNLYLLGLAALEWSDQNDSLSYYSLAGIHGRPYRTWGNAPGLPHKLGTSGYCPHSNSLFLTWHRPYLALFEEELYKQVKYYADAAPPDQAGRYAAAANSFRMPYWDWARGENAGTVPDFFTTQMINVVHTNGFNETIWNPLYSFYFHPLTPSVFNDKARAHVCVDMQRAESTQWSRTNSTLRWPTSDAPDAVSNQAAMYKSYEQQRRGLHDHIDGAFRRNTMNEFANTVEEAHGWVHGVIGGGWDGTSAQGHMWPLEYSAFEPLFMLHHTNVDRLFAMYQSAHPDRYFSPENIGSNGNVFLEDGSTVDADTSLLPFRNPAGGFWTPNTIRDTRTFGYAYPETINSREQTGPSKSNIQFATLSNAQGINASIAQLYGVSTRSRLMITGPSAGLDTSATNFTDWNILASSSSPSTFVAQFSLAGDFSSDAVGDVGSWVRMMPSSHAPHSTPSIATTTRTSVQGKISLMSNLLDAISAGKLASWNAKDVVPFLTSALTWRVLDAQGKPLPSHTLRAFTFKVCSATATIPASLSAPIEYAEDDEHVRCYPDVTRGKAGGVA